MSKLLAMMMNKKYTRLEYIESTGTQYIDTEYKATNNTRIDLDCFYDTRQQADLFFGSYSYSSNIPYNSFSVGHNTVNNTTRLRAIYGKQSYINDNFSYDTRHIFSLNKNNFYVDNVLEYSFNAETDFTTTHNILLFGCWVNGNIVNYLSRMKVYSCQIYDNETLVRDMIPVIRNSDNEIGMLDRVSGQFFGNAGTGKFRVPNEVGYTVVGSPTIVDGVVSGFSASNYLEIQQVLDTSKDFEIVTKINTGTLSTYFNLAIGNICNIGIAYQSNPARHNTRSYIKDENDNYISNGDYGITNLYDNTIYLLKLSQKLINDSYVIKIEISNNNGQTWITQNTWTSNVKIANNSIIFGASTTIATQYLRGDLYIKDTSIKLNNKLWFNGNPA